MMVIKLAGEKTAMIIDWKATLSDAGVLVQKTEADVLKSLESEMLDMEQASRLLDAVNELSDGFGDVINELYATEGTGDELLAAAASIEDRWSELCMMCAEKVRALRARLLAAVVSHHPSL